MSEQTTPRRGPPAPKREGPREVRDLPVGEAKKRAAPTTRVKVGGRTNRRMQDLTDLYLKQHPKESVRWVYDPQHKPDMSNVLARQVDGFRVVQVKELGEEMALPGMKPEEPVRIGDTVMMAIDASIAQQMRAELDQLAAEEMTRVEEEFQEAIDQVTHQKGGKTYAARPMGRSVMEEVEREVEGPESHAEATE